MKEIVVSAFTQSDNWVVSYYNDKMGFVIEKQLHYSITTKKQVREWCEYYFGQFNETPIVKFK